MNGIQFIALCAVAVIVALTYRWEIVMPRRERAQHAHQLEPYQMFEEAPGSRAARSLDVGTDEEVFDIEQWPASDPSTKVHELARRTHELFEGRESA